MLCFVLINSVLLNLLCLGLVLERWQSFLFQIFFLFRNRVIGWILLGNHTWVVGEERRFSRLWALRFFSHCGHGGFILRLLFKQSSALWKWHIYALFILHVHLRISRASSSRIIQSSHSSLLVVTLRWSWVTGSYEVGNDLTSTVPDKYQQ